MSASLSGNVILQVARAYNRKITNEIVDDFVNAASQAFGDASSIRLATAAPAHRSVNLGFARKAPERLYCEGLFEIEVILKATIAPPLPSRTIGQCLPRW